MSQQNKSVRRSRKNTKNRIVGTDSRAQRPGRSARHKDRRTIGYGGGETHPARVAAIPKVSASQENK